MQRVMRAVNAAQPHRIAETASHGAPDDIKAFLRTQNPRMASDRFQRDKNFASNRTAMPGLRVQALSIEPEAACHEPVRSVYIIIPLTETHRLFNQQITRKRLNIRRYGGRRLDAQRRIHHAYFDRAVPRTWTYIPVEVLQAFDETRV